MSDLEMAAHRVLVAYGEWAQTVRHESDDPQRIELRRSMVQLSEVLPVAVPA